MTLDDWIRNNGLDAEKFGKSLNLTGQSVRRYRSGERMPDAETVEQIRIATNGAVTIADLHQAHLAFIRSNPAEPKPTQGEEAA